MAAVTQSGAPTRHVTGDCVERTFNISGATGSTLDTLLKQIIFVAIQQSTAAGTVSLITSFSVSGSTITFASSAPMVNEIVKVTARVG